MGKAKKHKFIDQFYECTDLQFPLKSPIRMISTSKIKSHRLTSDNSTTQSSVVLFSAESGQSCLHSYVLVATKGKVVSQDPMRTLAGSFTIMLHSQLILSMMVLLSSGFKEKDLTLEQMASTEGPNMKLLSFLLSSRSSVLWKYLYHA